MPPGVSSLPGGTTITTAAGLGVCLQSAVVSSLANSLQMSQAAMAGLSSSQELLAKQYFNQQPTTAGHPLRQVVQSKHSGPTRCVASPPQQPMSPLSRQQPSPGEISGTASNPISVGLGPGSAPTQQQNPNSVAIGPSSLPSQQQYAPLNVGLVGSVPTSSVLEQLNSMNMVNGLQPHTQLIQQLQTNSGSLQNNNIPDIVFTGQ